MFQKRVSVLRQSEEVVLFPNPLRRLRGMKRTCTADQIAFLFERFARHAVPPFVLPFIDVALVETPLRQALHRSLVSGFGRPDKVVERNIELRPDGTKLTFHLIAVLERFETTLMRTLVHVLRMFIVAHEKMRVEAGQALVAGNDVGRDLFVRVAKVWSVIHVVDSRGQVEAHPTSSDPDTP